MKKVYIIAGTENGKYGERMVYLRDVFAAKQTKQEAWTDDLERVAREGSYYDTKEQAQAVIQESGWIGLEVIEYDLTAH